MPARLFSTYTLQAEAYKAILHFSALQTEAGTLPENVAAMQLMLNFR